MGSDRWEHGDGGLTHSQLYGFLPFYEFYKTFFAIAFDLEFVW
jgi:hypothetical protein